MVQGIPTLGMKMMVSSQLSAGPEEGRTLLDVVWGLLSKGVAGRGRGAGAASFAGALEAVGIDASRFGLLLINILVLLTQLVNRLFRFSFAFDEFRDANGPRGSRGGRRVVNKSNSILLSQKV